ncbi:MAG TPA: hypothetical protein VII99_07955, partial [Bacteroidia bacterium]
SENYSTYMINYSVKDSLVGYPPNTLFTQTVTFSATVNNRIGFNKFADYSNNTGIYADIFGTTINIPSQTAVGIGSLSETHTFQGAGQ